MNDVEELRSMIEKARRIVFFGGAGVSTESGIPDFRSEDGLYRQHFRYPPEVILSHSFFLQNPEEFFRFYRERVFPILPGKNALLNGKAKCGSSGTCPNGTIRKTQLCDYSEYRRSSSDGRKPASMGASRLRSSELLYEMRQIL